MKIPQSVVRPNAVDYFAACNIVKTILTRIKGIFIYQHTFGKFGTRTLLYAPLLILHPRHIFIGCRTLIRQGARIEVIPSAEGSSPRVCIGDFVNIEQNVHIVCRQKILIGNKVSIGPNCVLLDVAHPYLNIPAGAKIGDQIDIGETYLEVGEGTLIGAGVVLLPKVRIGKFCVIAANAVVTKDIPDYSVAGGIPAHIIKTYKKGGA